MIRTKLKVPFLDLKTQHESIKEEISIALQQVIDSTAFAGGPFVDQFEKEFALFCQCSHTVGVSSGTAALWMALLGLGVGKGDEVITVPNTFIATAEAISFSGAKPVFVDVLEETHTMNPTLLEASVTPRTKAIIPVHLFGQMADMDPIMEIARKHGLLVIEDACQAHGAQYKGRLAGSIGDAGCFSFYPGKNLGAYGEAGALVTNNSKLAKTVKELRDHGQTKKYFHTVIGWNSRMDGFQGAVLSVKLIRIEEWNEARRSCAKLYNELFTELDDSILLPREADYAKHVYHIYPIRHQNRDELMNTLIENEIGCGIHYPIPIHLQDAYSHLGLGKGSFPITEKCAEELISLPMFPDLNTEQITHVVNEIKYFVARQ